MLTAQLYNIMHGTNSILVYYPKFEKYQLCADIKKTVYSLMQLSIAMERKYHKKTTLLELDVQLDFLRYLVRMSYDSGYISGGITQEWIKSIDEAGRILGGLIRYFVKGEQSKNKSPKQDNSE